MSRERPIILLGSDGHHYAVNGAALARAKNADGETVGFTKASLASDFADLAEYIGVDEAGEPNGKLTEDYALSDHRRGQHARGRDRTPPRNTRN